MALSGSLSTNKYSGIMGLKFSWTAGTQSIVDNTTPINWTLESDGGAGYSYYTGNLTLIVDGSTVLSIPSRFLMDGGGAWKRTGSLTLKHNDDGKRSFSVSIAAGIYTYGAVNCTASTTFTIDQIKRRSVISGSDGTLGSANTLKLTRYNSAFTDTITAACGTASMEIVSGSTDDEVTWTPPVAWAAQNVSATSVTVKVTCKTYSGSTLLGETSATLTFAIPASVVPTVSLSVSDAKGYLATYGSYIQNKSQAAVTASGEGVYGSSIKSYTIVCGSLSGTGSELTFELPSAGKITVKVTATDSRGRSASASTTIDVIAYSAPMAEITSRYRCDANGNEDYLGAYAIAVFNAAVTSLGGKNSAAYALKYRVRGTTAWTSISLDALTGNFAPALVSQIFPAGIDNSYDVCIAVTDSFGTVESAYRTVQLGSPIMDADRANRALAFFQRAVDANTVAFGLPAKFNEGATFASAIYPTAIEMKPGNAAGHGGYIDFHHNNSEEDYTSRICEYIAGRLTVSGDFDVQGTLYAGGITVPKVIAVYNQSVAFTDGSAQYDNSNLKSNSICIIQRRSGTVGNAIPFTSTSYDGHLLITASSEFTGSMNLNIIIINP